MIYIVYVVAALFVLVLLRAVYAATRSSTFEMERSIEICGSAKDVYDILDDFRKWELWSPWEKKDPNMKKTFSGSSRGKGAVYAWDGDKNIGQGRQEIMESIPNSKVGINLDFIRPFEGHNQVEFLIEPTSNAVRVRWRMSGPLHFMVRFLGFNMDKMIGLEFENGLSSLKTLVETGKRGN